MHHVIQLIILGDDATSSLFVWKSSNYVCVTYLDMAGWLAGKNLGRISTSRPTVNKKWAFDIQMGISKLGHSRSATELNFHSKTRRDYFDVDWKEPIFVDGDDVVTTEEREKSEFSFSSSSFKTR